VSLTLSAHPDVGLKLALALVASSDVPLLLLDGSLAVIAASASFCRAFDIDPDQVAQRSIYALGAGEWDAPRLRSLLDATVSQLAKIDAYEIDLKRGGLPARRLVLKAQKLDYGEPEAVRVLLTISDVTDARLAEKVKDELVRDKAFLLQEVQHRVANSLQIIASLLLQSARKVQSEETRSHLRDAHSRVMSIASVQQQLSASGIADVEFGAYLAQLCQSLGASMIQDHAKLRMKVVVDDSVVDANVSISLGLVVTELVINALKHAFPNDRGGQIIVAYKSTGSVWRLSVGDDGVGMPKHRSAAKPGLGTSIVEALAKQLGADVEVFDAKPGTRVSLVHREIAARPAAANDEPQNQAV
jgi:two-component system, sensor histidine kinase PdtaS